MSETSADDRVSTERPSFEQLLEELEGIVSTLERGAIPLEDALAAFEKGTALAGEASAILATAEARVSQILQDREGHVHEVAGSPNDA